MTLPTSTLPLLSLLLTQGGMGRSLYHGCSLSPSWGGKKGVPECASSPLPTPRHQENFCPSERGKGLCGWLGALWLSGHPVVLLQMLPATSVASLVLLSLGENKPLASKEEGCASCGYCILGSTVDTQACRCP